MKIDSMAKSIEAQREMLDALDTMLYGGGSAANAMKMVETKYENPDEFGGDDFDMAFNALEKTFQRMKSGEGAQLPSTPTRPIPVPEYEPDDEDDDEDDEQDEPADAIDDAELRRLIIRREGDLVFFYDGVRPLVIDLRLLDEDTGYIELPSHLNPVSAGWMKFFTLIPRFYPGWVGTIDDAKAMIANGYDDDMIHLYRTSDYAFGYLIDDESQDVFDNLMDELYHKIHAYMSFFQSLDWQTYGAGFDFCSGVSADRANNRLQSIMFQEAYVRSSALFSSVVEQTIPEGAEAVDFGYAIYPNDLSFPDIDDILGISGEYTGDEDDDEDDEPDASDIVPELFDAMDAIAEEDDDDEDDDEDDEDPVEVPQSVFMTNSKVVEAQTVANVASDVSTNAEVVVPEVVAEAVVKTEVSICTETSVVEATAVEPAQAVASPDVVGSPLSAQEDDTFNDLLDGEEDSGDDEFDEEDYYRSKGKKPPKDNTKFRSSGNSNPDNDENWTIARR